MTENKHVRNLLLFPLEPVFLCRHFLKPNKKIKNKKKPSLSFPFKLQWEKSHNISEPSRWLPSASSLFHSSTHGTSLLARALLIAGAGPFSQENLARLPTLSWPCATWVQMQRGCRTTTKAQPCQSCRQLEDKYSLWWSKKFKST